LHELLRDTVKVEGKVNVVDGKEGWRTPDETWMEDAREEEEEIHFVKVIQVNRAGSDEELAAEIARTEVAVNDCYRRRARRAWLDLGIWGADP
jgi:hypothetical protein